MATKDLDAEFPTGDPQSVTCRWCKAVRVRKNSGLLCRKCDGPASEL